MYGLIRFISQENQLNYNETEIKKFASNFVLSSLHKQDKNSNDHINIIIPNVFVDFNKSDNLTRIDLGKKKYCAFLKNLNNQLMLGIGHNYLDYQIKSQRSNRNRKNKLHYATQQLQEQFSQQQFILNEKSQKIEKRISIYINRMEQAIEDKDRSKFEKNLEYVEQNLSKLESATHLEDTSLLQQVASIKSILDNFEDSNPTPYPKPQ